MKVLTRNMSTDRRTFLGGSDVAAVLGLSPYRTPLDLYYQKTTEASDEEETRNAVAKLRGKRLEPYVCDMLTQEHGLFLLSRNQRYTDPEHQFLACEVDAETPSEGGRGIDNVEIKTVHPFKMKEWGEELTDSIPVHYTAQAMHGLMITGRDVCRFAVLIGDELRLYRVERDIEIIKGMRAREVAFWRDHVLAHIPPEPVNEADVSRLFDKDSGTSIEATDDIADHVSYMRLANVDIAQLEKERDRARLAVELFMGDAAALTRHGKVIATWKSQTTNRLDQKALTAAHPELVEQFKRASESRVFRVK